MTIPSEFLWGAGTSAHQVEGNNRWNDWWAWEQAHRVPESSGRACDHYNLYEKDLDLAQRLDHNAFRFSIEWSRVEKSPGQFDDEELAHYARVAQACLVRKLTPIVTLHHFTNPVWFADGGGWLSPKSPELFARYVRKVVERLPSDVRWWITINEPTVLVFCGYLEGKWPPGERSVPSAIRSIQNLVAAHRLAYRVIKEQLASARVGLAHHLRPYDPCRPNSVADRLAARIRHKLANEWVLNACRGTSDFIGVNYYTRDFVRFPMMVCKPEHHAQRTPYNSLGWEIYPEGLSRVLIGLKRCGLPVLITENGVAAQGDGVRWDFIREHVARMTGAIADGVPVAGYLYWSLIDNFEWADGFGPRFGLAEVDYRTMERRVRPSAEKFKELILKK